MSFNYKVINLFMSRAGSLKKMSVDTATATAAASANANATASAAHKT